MEVLISGFTFNKVNIRHDSEDTVDVKHWDGVSFGAILKDILSIEWSGKDLEGSLALQWLPSTIIRASFADSALSGSIDLTDLPPKMHSLNVSTNKLGSPL